MIPSRAQFRLLGRRVVLTSCLVLGALPMRAAPPELTWLPADLPKLPVGGPVLCSRDYLTPAQGAEVLAAATAHFKDRATWGGYAALLRQKIQAGAGLDPWPERTPLHAVVRDRREHDGYSVENVILETVPGVYACGNLYRPLHVSGLVPAILTPHGHTMAVEKAADWAHHGRFDASVQIRAATLARMGAVVLTIDMFGYGDSLVQFGPAAHRRAEAMTFQLWNNIRALDFLASLDGIDPHRLAVTGESGGATQTLLVTALDPRVAVSVPVVMVSSYFFGGCPCESGRPIHRSAEHFANNAMIAALAAPRPMLVVSDGGDWTKNTPAVEFPFLRSIYRLFGAETNVANVHLPAEGHDYGPSKRTAMYQFVAARLDLAADPARRDEGKVTIEPPETLRCFDSAHPVPPQAWRDVAEAFAELQRRQQ